MVRWLGFLAAFGISLAAFAADYPAPKDGDWIARDFGFHTGEVMPELRIHYRTVGAPAGEPVLVLHGTAGSSLSMLTPSFAGELFAPGQPLDAARYYIIVPDAIGAGKSSKPSDGLRTKFPRYNYDDMVQAQYRLVTEGLGIKHLRLVIGNSMGGMQTWLWAQKYPGMMDVAVPMAALPAAMSGRNWMMRRLLVETIRADPELGPDREKADAVVKQRMSGPFNADANDLVYQWESSYDYDPAPGLERIDAALLAINAADDERNPPEMGVLDREIKRVKNGRVFLIPASEETTGHSTTASARFYKSQLDALLRDAPRR